MAWVSFKLCFENGNSKIKHKELSGTEETAKKKLTELIRNGFVEDFSSLVSVNVLGKKNKKEEIWRRQAAKTAVI